MQRYFLEESFTGSRFFLSGEDLHHITRVMRMKEGDHIVCVLPDGRSAVCAIAEITGERIAADIVEWEEGSAELPVRVAIASGLPKGDKLEWIIQKGTELGAHEFVPFIAARSIVKWDERKAEKKVERWQKIAKEAAEQSHRSQQPQVFHPKSLNQLLERSREYTHKLIAFEEEAKQGEAAILAQTLGSIKAGESILIAFGPEGGFSNEEVELFQSRGFLPCGLGPRILRTETAPLYVLAAVSYHLELLE